MNNIKKQVDTFLRLSGIHADTVDIDKGCREFVEEMTRGLDGSESSLRMICTYLSPEGEIPVNKPVVVMDTGGTNFRVALVRFDSDRKPVTDYFKSYPMPGSTGEISRDEFYDTVSDYLMPVINESGIIGWCFSFPTEILPDKDGRLLYFDKEVRVRGMDGDMLGASLLKKLREKGVKGEKSIVVLNDTVATLLGGKSACPGREFGSYVGYILGTGTNTCYIEDNRNISKLPDVSARPGQTIINTESGGFDRAPRSAVDIDFDRRTADPGAQLFEKMISGAYQGSLFYELLRRAAVDGLFSTDYASYISGIGGLASRDINDFLTYPYSDANVLARGIGGRNSGSEQDRVALYFLIDGFVERAAKLSAINLAAVVVKSGSGANPCRPVCIAAEGTTFEKSAMFRKKLDYYVKHDLNDRLGLFCEFITVESSTLIGTAIAGLLN